MRTLYFFRNMSGFQEFPIPDEDSMNNYHIIDVDDDFIWKGEVVDELTGKLIMPVPDLSQLSSTIRLQRDGLMEVFSWRIERYNREVRLGLATTENLQVLDTYMQQLADITEQDEFPHAVNWPTPP
jgi:hypothetical protein